MGTKRPVASLGKVDLMPSPFYPASVEFFQLHGGMFSLMQALAIPSSRVHNTKTYFTIESISVLAASLRQACRDVASGADRHRDITFIQNAGS